MQSGRPSVPLTRWSVPLTDPLFPFQGPVLDVKVFVTHCPQTLILALLMGASLRDWSRADLAHSNQVQALLIMAAKVELAQEKWRSKRASSRPFEFDDLKKCVPADHLQESHGLQGREPAKAPKSLPRPSGPECQKTRKGQKVPQKSLKSVIPEPQNSKSDNKCLIRQLYCLEFCPINRLKIVWSDIYFW